MSIERDPVADLAERHVQVLLRALVPRDAPLMRVEPRIPLEQDALDEVVREHRGGSVGLHGQAEGREELRELGQRPRRPPVEVLVPRRLAMRLAEAAPEVEVPAERHQRRHHPIRQDPAHGLGDPRLGHVGDVLGPGGDRARLHAGLAQDAENQPAVLSAAERHDVPLGGTIVGPVDRVRLDGHVEAEVCGAPLVEVSHRAWERTGDAKGGAISPGAEERATVAGKKHERVDRVPELVMTNRVVQGPKPEASDLRPA